MLWTQHLKIATPGVHLCASQPGDTDDADVFEISLTDADVSELMLTNARDDQWVSAERPDYLPLDGIQEQNTPVVMT